MKLAVVGSRGWEDTALLRRVIEQYKPQMIISGGAFGADSMAASWASENKVPVQLWIPDWRAYGKRAGAMRNRQIVDACDGLVAFWDGKSKGTKITIDMATDAKKFLGVVFDKTAKH